MRSRGLRACGQAGLLLLVFVVTAPAASAQVPELELPVYEYHSYATLAADLQRLAQEHADIAKLASLGKSHRGLDLWSLEVGNLSDPGYASRPGFYLDGGHHGNEALGIEAAYLFAEWLVEGYDSDPEARALVEGARIHVTPLVNPDGKTANTRQNGALVNLNRNYPFHWDERGTDPAPPGGNYAGPSAGSEPETQANMAFIQAHDLDVYVSLHTGSYDIVRPFGHAPDEPVPDEELYQRLLGWAFESTGLQSRYPNGSGESICWAYGAQGVFSVLLEVFSADVRPGGTPQVGPGPLSEEEIRAVLEPHFQVMKHLLANAGKWGAHLEAWLEGLRGDTATLVVENTGFAPARGLAWAATSLELLGPLPAELAPGAQARVPVRLDAPSHLRLTYQRLAVQPEDATMAQGVAEVVVEFRTASIEPRPAPGAEVGLVLLAAVALAVARRR